MAQQADPNEAPARMTRAQAADLLGQTTWIAALRALSRDPEYVDECYRRYWALVNEVRAAGYSVETTSNGAWLRDSQE